MKGLLIYFLLNVYLIGTAQKNYEDFYSSEEQAYYSKNHYKEFKLADSAGIVSFKAFGIAIQSLQDFTPFASVYSIYERDRGNNKTAGLPDILKQIRDTNEIGILNSFIIKTDENETTKAVLYEDSKYDRFDRGETGVWIAICNKKDNIWHKYYTGLAENAPIYLKWNSKLPLIKTDNILQIEAAFVQRLDGYGVPATMGKYALIKDGIIAELDLNKIIQDSDGDGLTDIEERKLMLNPNNADTDGDGIPDDIDINPRFNLRRNDKTLLYEAIVNQSFGRKDKEATMLIDTFSAKFREKYSTILIVSNDTSIQSIQHCHDRIIVLTEKEYQQHHSDYPNEMEKYYLSPLFKVDDKPNTYKLNLGGPFWSYDFLIEQKGGKWFITELRFMIS